MTHQQMVLISLSCIILMVLPIQIGSKEIPEFVHICHRSDPNVAACVKNSVEFLRPYLARGIPEIDVPSIEPLFIPNVTLLDTVEPNARMRAILRNLNVYGISHFIVERLVLDPLKNIYRADVILPFLHMIGDFDINAKIVVLPVKGVGNAYINASGCHGECTIKANIIEQNGQREMSFSSMHLRLTVEDFNVEIENLFNGERIINAAANEFIRSNKELFFRNALPFLLRKIEEILLDISNRITSGLNYDTVFPE